MIYDTNVVGYYINTGERTKPVKPLSLELHEALRYFDPSVSELMNRLDAEFPWAADRRLQLYLLQEGLPRDHPDYVSGKQAKAGWGKQVDATITAWCGLEIADPYSPGEPHMLTDGFHGTPLSCALLQIQSGDFLRQVGKETGVPNRTRSGDKVRPDQAYIAEFDTARRSTLRQFFQNAI